MVVWLSLAVIFILFALFLYWTLVISEGSYFGARLVVWLYDLSAGQYDSIKKFDENEEDWYVGFPLWKTIRFVRRPLVLDVATGSGRLALALLRRPFFDGHIVALDLSHKMLRTAEEKLTPYSERVTLVHQDAMQLPFPDEVFDAVTCLEALEFLPSPARALQEMVRVLRPGGVLLTTNRVGWESKFLPGKALSPKRLHVILDGLPLQAVEVRRWQVFYDQVWARKAGQVSAEGNGNLPLTDILFCPHCSTALLDRSPASFHCSTCHRVYSIKEGIFSLVDESAFEPLA